MFTFRGISPSSVLSPAASPGLFVLGRLLLLVSATTEAHELSASQVYPPRRHATLQRPLELGIGIGGALPVLCSAQTLRFWLDVGARLTLVGSPTSLGRAVAVAVAGQRRHQRQQQ